MRPAEIADDLIIEAGKDLVAAGRSVTGFALRTKVGGGNAGRLKQVWDEYVAKTTMAQVSPPAELPVEVAEEVANVNKALTERIAALAVELNDKAVKAAERRVAEVVRAAGEQREQADRELADASQTVDELEATLESAQKENESLTQKLAEAQATVQAQAVELAQLRERLAAVESQSKAAAEQHAAEVGRFGEAADRVNAELERVRVELATAKAKAEAEHDQHAEQRKQAAQETHRLAERMNRAEADRDSARQQLAASREDVAKLAGKVEEIEKHRAELMRALASSGKSPAKPAG